jgi:hypothetical protein
MANSKTVGETFATRRDLLRLGGLGLLGASGEGVWPLRTYAKSKVNPRGTARNVVFYEMSGAISHVESFDFKETPGTPPDIDVRKIAGDLYLPHALFPRLEKQIDKFAILRSLQSHEEVHFRGQYYVQTGRQMNVAFAREIPAIGSVIAMELEPRRRPNDTFPTYMSFNLEKGFPGALQTGFLPPRFSVVDINTDAAAKTNALDQAAMDLLQERWALLSKLREAEKDRLTAYGREMAGYESFYEAAYQLLSDERWPAAFRISDEDRQRYGDTSVGTACILARNALAQDAGTHYIHICHPGWDHHVYIWDHSKESSHYKLCAEYDQAFAAMMEDLATTPSKTNPQQTLLDETLVVCMSEFGRTPGALNNMAGRDHYNRCFPALFAGAGVAGNRRLGSTDSGGEKCIDTGWTHSNEQPRIENVIATMLSALGIDWGKEIRNTPSGRPYVYVDPLGAHGYIPTDEISSIYG